MMYDIGRGYLFNDDCFNIFPQIEDNSIDLILCDLPYGTTQNKWDTVLPLDQLWKEYKRICKGAIVLTAQTPFDKVLGVSNINMIKYEWIWKKSRAPGHLNAKRAPLRNHENVLVFYEKLYVYNPQDLIKRDVPYHRKARKNKGSGENYGVANKEAFGEFENYPKTVLEFQSVGRSVHPTQKPVELFEYLIKTYTDEDMLVLDNCSGSGTTAIACENTNRNWICIEKDKEYFEKSKARIEQHVKEKEIIDHCLQNQEAHQ